MSVEEGGNYREGTYGTNIHYQNSILWRGDAPENYKFKPSYDKSTRVSRLRAGKVPDWAKNAEAEDDDVPADAHFRRRSRSRAKEKKRKKQQKVGESTAISRLKRLVGHDLEPEKVDRAEAMRRRREEHEAMVLENQEEEAKKVPQRKAEEAKVLETGEEVKAKILKEDEDEDDKDKVKEEDDDEIELKRLRAREIALAKRSREEDNLKVEETKEESEDEDEDSGEEEDSSEDDDDAVGNVMMKPVFVSRVARETLKEKEQLEKDAQEVEKKKEENLKQRKVESKQLLVNEVVEDEQRELDGYDENAASDVEMPDDDDEKNEAEEYDLWKIRELKRIKMDREAREKTAKELAWIAKRRAMTDAEREEDDRRLDAIQPKKAEVEQFLFMQKYFHKGGYFQDKAADGTEPLYLRNFHEPTADEMYDKNLLPKAMQLRRGQFGKIGQVKHTHLSATDTTDWSAAWALKDQNNQKYQRKMATASGINNFDRPGERRK